MEPSNNEEKQVAFREVFTASSVPCASDSSTSDAASSTRSSGSGAGAAVDVKRHQPGVFYSPVFSFPTQPSPGSKVGYFVLGLFLGPIGVIIAQLTSRGKSKAVKRASLTYSLLGVVALLLSCYIGFLVLSGFVVIPR